MTVLSTRLISGKGLLKLDSSSSDYKKAKVFTLYVDVVRHPRNESLNYNYNPPQSFYGTLNFFRGDYLVGTETLRFPSQSFDFYLDPSAQAMYATECAYAGILQSFVNLGVALGVTPISVTDHIKDWVSVDLMWDVCKVVCFADTALQLQVSTKPFDLCPEQSSKEPDPPPPPPESKPSVPKGSPLGNGTNPPVSPPYTSPDDGGDTVPSPGDSATSPPPPPSGVRENVVVLWYINDDASNGRTTNVYVWGHTTDARSIAISGQGHLQVLCYGAAPTTSDPVSPTPIWVDMLAPDGNPFRYGNVNQPTIQSITPI